MSETQTDPELRQALYDLHRYLSDQVAPLMVIDSIEQLLDRPPQVAATAIEGWVATQYRGGGQGASVTDYLFHALKKLHMMGHLKLIPKERLSVYLEALGRVVSGLCPQEDRQSFAEMVKSLGQVEADLPPMVQVGHVAAGPAGARAGSGTRAAGAVAAGQGNLSEEVARGLKRFSILLDRLQKAPAAEGLKTAPSDQRRDLTGQILATAALSSRSGEDLDKFMQRLAGMGIDARTDQVFRALSRSLPGWAIRTGGEGAPAASPLTASRPAEAMRRLVSMAGTPVEGLKRFTEMVQASIEQFNEGNLPQASAMFEVAERLVTDRKVEEESAKLVRSRAHESLSLEVLRGFAEKPDRHALLRRVLNFFPALSVAGLMADLDGEEKRDRRKLYLALLEAHGPAAREAALDRLTTMVREGGRDPNGYFLRNLVFLLRRIPRTADASPEREVALLARVAQWGNPLIVIKEAIGALGQLKGSHAEAALIGRLGEYEKLLMSDQLSSEDEEEVKVLLDRIASALARLGTPNGWRTVFNHAMNGQPKLGDTMARLDDLSSQDLSADRDLSEHLVAALKAELPKKVLGFVVQKKSGHALHLVHAMSSTQTASVRNLLQEIVGRYPDLEFGQAAARALTGLAAPQRPAETPAMGLSGDLDLFGLPSLLQTVAEARMSGTLTLVDREERPFATTTFDAGKVKDCRAGALAGEPAFYQLFERPLPGTFHFRSRRPGIAEDPDEAGKTGEPFEVLPAMLEAMRRHDELQQARAIVPDDASLKPTGVKPTGPSDGEDNAFLHAVWTQASSGATPAVCEGAVPADAYRIRRLYAHWVEQGALQAK